MTIKYWVVDLTIYKEKCIPTEEIIEAVKNAAKSVGGDVSSLDVTGPFVIEDEEGE